MMRADTIEADWRRILYVWMHDPVDKALGIRNHKARAARYISRALGEHISYREIDDEVASADMLAAMADRLPMPAAGPDCARAVGPEDGPLEIRHPVSGEKDVLSPLAVSEDTVSEIIEDIVGALPADTRMRFLALWRLLPGRLAERLGPDYSRLPADTRVPDHSLFQHADIATGIATGLAGNGGYAYLSVSLGPVQTFIEAARSVRDLWSGSALLSWLAFQGMRPVIEALGPTAMVFPALRGNPLADLWLRNACGLDMVPLPSTEARRAPSLPNRFLALVPWGIEGNIAKRMAKACQQSIRKGWHQITTDVHRHVDRELSSIYADWDHRWQDQVDSFFEITTSLLPERPLNDDMLASLVGRARQFGDVWRDAEQVRAMDRVIPMEERYRFDQRGAGRWQAQLELSARLMEAQRAIRHIPVLPQNPPTPPKCSLLGSYEQMGPSELRASAGFWTKAQESHLRLRERERFSAIALCKRFAAETTLQRELELGAQDRRFSDTATVAAAAWLHDASIVTSSNWNGRWLHQRTRSDVEPGDEAPPPEVWARIKQAKKERDRPPSYYAVLRMDADNMGRWLKGEYAPPVSQVLHAKMTEYFRRLGTDALGAKRPVGPALHAAISEALNNFASHVAPQIVQLCYGTMIYSGGDDVLALIPARRAVACANALRRAFRGEDGRFPGWTAVNGHLFLAMGSEATLSAGIAFVHYKHDLRAAIEAARMAEAHSKQHGRNRVTLQFMRRSGEQPLVGQPWELAPLFQSMVDHFAGGATDRWVYLLRRELPTLEDEGLPAVAVHAEIRRLVARSQMHASPHDGGASPSGAKWWEEFCRLAGKEKLPLTAFAQLCQGASFVARGHDE